MILKICGNFIFDTKIVKIGKVCMGDRSKSEKFQTWPWCLISPCPEALGFNLTDGKAFGIRSISSSMPSPFSPSSVLERVRPADRNSTKVPGGAPSQTHVSHTKLKLTACRLRFRWVFFVTKETEATTAWNAPDFQNHQNNESVAKPQIFDFRSVSSR